MLYVKLLTEGFVTPNGFAFLFPIVKNLRILEDHGIRLTLHTKESRDLENCDILMIESRFFSDRWAKETEMVLDRFAYYSENVPKLLYFNIGDSSTWDHAKMLPYISKYYKSQLLRDLSGYTKSFYGNRIYTDYYHRNFGVNDEAPEYSQAIDAGQIGKLGVSWNSGLADYSCSALLLKKAYKLSRARWFLRYPDREASPCRNRPMDFSCRMGVSYPKETVSFQRKQILSRLINVSNSNKLNRKRYFEEMSHSKVVVSPFGFGEITLKDFEAFLTGSLLFKPDMSHMETWPDFFRDGETIVTHRWDLADLGEKLDTIIRDYDRYLDIAVQGQNEYLKYTHSRQAGELFCNHFVGLLKGS